MSWRPSQDNTGAAIFLQAPKLGIKLLSSVQEIWVTRPSKDKILFFRKLEINQLNISYKQSLWRSNPDPETSWDLSQGHKKSPASRPDWQNNFCRKVLWLFPKTWPINFQKKKHAEVWKSLLINLAAISRDSNS